MSVTLNNLLAADTEVDISNTTLVTTAMPVAAAETEPSDIDVVTVTLLPTTVISGSNTDAVVTVKTKPTTRTTTARTTARTTTTTTESPEEQNEDAVYGEEYVDINQGADDLEQDVEPSKSPILTGKTPLSARN